MKILKELNMLHEKLENDDFENSSLQSKAIIKANELEREIQEKLRKKRNQFEKLKREIEEIENFISDNNIEYQSF